MTNQPQEKESDRKEVREYIPLIADLIERAKSEERESTTDFIKTIHTELHNGRMEDAYRLLCKFLNALAE